MSLRKKKKKKSLKNKIKKEKYLVCHILAKKKVFLGVNHLHSILIIVVFSYKHVKKNRLGPFRFLFNLIGFRFLIDFKIFWG
jgi:hypothetical protein